MTRARAKLIAAVAEHGYERVARKGGCCVSLVYALKNGTKAYPGSTAIVRAFATSSLRIAFDDWWEPAENSRDVSTKVQPEGGTLDP